MLRKVEPITLGCDVRIEGDNIAVTGLSLRDAELAAYVGEHPQVDRPAVIERGLKVGLIALRNAGVTLNVDFVAREFERLMHRTDESHDRAAAALEAALRETFAAKDGKLPRTLEQFLGDNGTLRRLVDDLFDEERQDSAIGRMRTLLAGYFDGDGAIVAVRGRADVVGAAVVRRDLDGIRAQLNAIVGMKSKLTSISTVTGDVRNGLEALRQGVLDRVIAIEGNVADVVTGRQDVA